MDAIRSISPGFIFTTSIPPVICAGALASVKYLKDEGGKELRRLHQEKAMELKTLLKDYNVEEIIELPIRLYRLSCFWQFWQTFRCSST